jgi:hypothetical protein
VNKRRYTPYRKNQTPFRPTKPKLRKDIGAILFDAVLDQLPDDEVRRRLAALHLTAPEIISAMAALNTMCTGVTL